MINQDQEIQQKIIEQLAWDDRIYDEDIEVEVDGAKVTLTGIVPTYFARQAAVLDAINVPGVTSVINELSVEYPATDVFPDDNKIQHDIYDAIKNDPDAYKSEVNVEVSDGQVVIQGSVDSYWKKMLVEQIAAHTVGVVGTVNKITVVPTHTIADHVIAEEILKAFDRNVHINVNNMDIKVENGIVTLSGIVANWHVRKIAFDIAQYTRGVIDVRDNMSIEESIPIALA